jgi:hypothetical protein
MKQSERIAALPEPELSPYKDFRTIHVLTLGFYNEAIEESEKLMVRGFCSGKILNWYEAAMTKAKDFCLKNGLSISWDESDIAGIKMVVYKDEAA